MLKSNKTLRTTNS